MSFAIRLQIIYRVCIISCFHYSQLGKLTAQHVGKEVDGVLLALIVTHLGNQQLTLMTKIVVVAHLARQEGIGTLLDGT